MKPRATSAKTGATREKILLAAERVYAASGFHGMSLRDVTLMAGVNLASVNYHFGSKQKLILAIAERRLGPVNQQRRALLAAAVARHGEGPVPVEELVEAFLLPLYEVLGEKDESHLLLVRSVGQLLIDDHGRFDQIVRSFYLEVFGDFLRELGRSLPHLGMAELQVRFYTMFCMVIGSRLLHHRLSTFTPGLTTLRRRKLLMAQLHAFVVAGLTAGT